MAQPRNHRHRGRGRALRDRSRCRRDALRTLLHLNDKYAIDGCDPNGFANILWCFGKFDRPFPERPVWGTIRPMSLDRAKAKYDTASYIARWGGADPVPPDSLL
ncbi:MAG: hypothetical protein JJD97_00790 [Gemmatimonadaceae bacterium]|nr:hypothetical protein [Gemmatimonadaceae bacterium]